MAERARLRLALIYAAVALALPLGAGLAPELIPRMACPVKALTGLPCPTCGSGRSLLALGDLRILEALRWNPLLPLGVGALLAWPLFEAWRLAWSRRRGRPAPDIPPAALRWGIIIGGGLGWIYLLAVGR